MLQSIREYTQGWIAGIIVSIIIVTFSLWGVHNYFQGDSANTEVASVNGVDITRLQFDKALERIRRQLQGKSQADLALARNETFLKHQALQALIELEVLKQASFKEGFRVFTSQVDHYLETIPEFQVQGQFSVDRMQQVLSSSLLSLGDFLKLIHESLLIEQPKLGIILSSFALPNETAATMALVNQEREVAYLVLAKQQIMAQVAAISPADIQKYYQAHQKEFMTPEQVSVDYLELTQKNIAEQIKPSDAELEKTYEENKNSFVIPGEWKYTTWQLTTKNTKETAESVKQKADALLSLLKKDISSPATQKFIQDNTITISKHDFANLQAIPEGLKSQFLQLKKVGDLSSVIETPDGYTIIQINAIKKPQAQTFEQAKPQVLASYVKQHAEEKFAELREQLASITYEHPESLTYAAKELHLPIQKSDLFIKKSASVPNSQDITNFAKVREIAFSNEVLNLQNNSDLIVLTPGRAIVLRVHDHLQPKVQSLQAVEKTIEAKLKEREAEQQLKNTAEKLLSDYQTGNVPPALQNNNGTWVNTGFIGRYAAKINPAILDLAFRLAHPAGDQKPVYGITRLSNGDYVLVAVKSSRQGAQYNDKQFPVFSEQVQNSEGIAEYLAYKQSQMHKAKIKIQST